MSQVGDQDIASLLLNAQKAFSALPAPIMDLASFFISDGEELALVGGPVRDAFLGVSPNDFDFATSATPDRCEEILKRWTEVTWDIGRAFGTIGARKGQLVVEVTTYRTDSYEIGSRKPEVVYGDFLEGDLSRRDFTVNAMAMRLPQLTLVDPYNGLEDLAEGRLRTPVSAEQSFDDDPLRMMRAARFVSQLGIDPDMDIINAMSSMAHRLEIVSRERVRAELERLLVSPYPRKGIELMVHTGICDLVLPEVSALVDTKDEHKRHKDVYEHTLTVLDQAMDLETDSDGDLPGPDLILRLAALLHDIGKPATRRFEGDGTVSFHHHEIVGAKMARRRLKALTFDKHTVQAVCDLVALHLRFHGYGDAHWTDSAVRRYVADAGDQLLRLHRLTRADCTTHNKRKAMMLSSAYDDLEERITVLSKKEKLDSIRPDLNGEEIMRLLDLRPGPEVGRAYKFLLHKRIERGPVSPEEAELELRQWWASQDGKK